jgi:uncharacterized protein DUF5071
MDTDPKDLIPRTKTDYERVQAVKEAGYPAVEPILPELLEWMQDYNWPVAQGLQPLLASIGEPLAPHIRPIFKTDDALWKYWILEKIVAHCPALARQLREEILSLAELQPRDDDERLVQEISQEILCTIDSFRRQNQVE